MKTLAICSMYGNPIGPHHLNYLEASKGLADDLIVIVNNDSQVALKGSIPFYNENERLRLIKSIKCVTDAVISIDKGKSVAKSLEKLLFMARDGYNRIIFTNGGDQTSANPEEKAVCEKYGVQMMFGVGGGKTGSSSDYLQKAINYYNASMIGQPKSTAQKLRDILSEHTKGTTIDIVWGPDIRENNAQD